VRLVVAIIGCAEPHPANPVCALATVFCGGSAEIGARVCDPRRYCAMRRWTTKRRLKPTSQCGSAETLRQKAAQQRSHSKTLRDARCLAVLVRPQILVPPQATVAHFALAGCARSVVECARCSGAFACVTLLSGNLRPIGLFSFRRRDLSRAAGD
jgi:hypothetical protein